LAAEIGATEIGRCLVYGRHVDRILNAPAPSKLSLWHHMDSALLTGEARFRIDVYRYPELVRSQEIVLGYGELYEVVNYEGTPEYPGDWNIEITLLERGRTPSAKEMFELLKNWMRNQYLLEYVGVAVASAIPAALVGYVAKRQAK